MAKCDLITQEDLAALAQQDFEALATAWGELNGWRWPKWLPNEESRVYVPGGRRGQLMRWIEEAVGMRACYRLSLPWKDKSEDEFNDFWRGFWEGHPPSRARWEHRLLAEAREHSAKRGK